LALIVEELTPPGAGAVSVLEVTGKDALESVRSLTKNRALQPGDLRVLRLSEGGEDLDEVLCLVVDAERVEIHLHGSPILIERVSQALGGSAQHVPGRGDLEGDARTLLAQARGELAARILLDQAEGALTRRLVELSQLDELGARAGLEELLKRSIAVAPALLPPRVVLAGPSNTGKSTLFNALVGSERAITSDEPGTTRDVVVGYAILGGMEYELLDTAGVREVEGGGGDGEVEREGQRAAQALREGAGAVFWLERAGAHHGEIPAGCELVETHADQLADAPEGAISALHDPLGAREELSRRLAGSTPKWLQGEAVLYSGRLRSWGAGLLSGSTRSLSSSLLECVAGEVAH